MKTKISFFGYEATDFHSRKIPEANCNYNCWLVTLIDSVLNKDKKCYPQVFLKEWRYIEKEKKLIRYISET